MVVSQLKLEPPLLQAILGREVVIEGSSSFHFESFQVERVEELVTSGEGDVSYMDNEKRSPLHAAAFVGNSDIVEILIEQVL